VAVGNDAQFRKLADLVGRPEWADDPRFARNRDRVGNRDLVDGMVQEMIATRTRAEWIEALDAAGIPAGPINDVAEALDSPQTRGRGMVTDFDHPALGLIRMLGLPIRQEGTPASIRRHPPLLGEHTDEVLSDMVGLAASEIERLRAGGVI
jgi:crotonobetainyl-CoA:carnitine CoA-transferase CaiB-like acyl-CoA transferase